MLWSHLPTSTISAGHHWRKRVWSNIKSLCAGAVRLTTQILQAYVQAWVLYLDTCAVWYPCQMFASHNQDTCIAEISSIKYQISYLIYTIIISNIWSAVSQHVLFTFLLLTEDVVDLAAAEATQVSCKETSIVSLKAVTLSCMTKCPDDIREWLCIHNHLQT